LVIRELTKEDINETVELWYKASLIAHDFIPVEYWEENKKTMVEVYLPNSRTMLALEGERIVGFVSMVDDLLAAIFVDPQEQGKGIGKKLLGVVKESRKTIRLNVYKDNLKTVDFYKNQGFQIISEAVDKNTEKSEFLMEWSRHTERFHGLAEDVKHFS